MINLFFWIALSLAALDWIAAARGWQRLRWITKPGALASLIAWYYVAGGWAGPLVAAGIGLVFSLAGDVFLMLPARFFLAGMAAFAIAHIAYIAGFLQLPLQPGWGIALPVLAAAGVFAAVNGRIRAGLEHHGETAMRLPVLAYEILICTMLLAALSTLLCPLWGLRASLLVSAGAVLFVASDGTLAFNRFVSAKESRKADLLVMVTYHAAQFLIAGGMLDQFTAGA